ncbi:recQ-mediated genome instability protein 1 isoform X2 [Amaranthus tricolor]|uniref:recQ-mediated genome instability protein 1 isoform X2 n=1 Tax=Amaranthus tricolor TaxID=29722 RepID=UPI00258A1B63|nr:recQ-mediated genome instability protein 1 isoform X2 [Amaranthus tricolor]
MSRRRFRTVYTSSSDDEDVLQQPQFENPNHSQSLQQQQEFHEQDDVFDEAIDQEFIEQQQQSATNPNPNYNPNIDSLTLNSIHSTLTINTAPIVSEPPSVEISDEEFIDVSEDLSPPFVSPRRVVNASSGCPVNDHLRRLGLNLRREWLDSCIIGLQNAHHGFSNFNVEMKAKLCFGQFLYSDMRYSGAASLPENVHQLHNVDLPGPFVLQVDEVINISCSLRERYKNAPPGLKRCLKLSMTDGVQHVFGMEYRPIKSLEVLVPAGFKVVIQNVHVRRGLLMLVPEVLEILGGCVDELEDARQRLVQEVNKPPRGRRTRNGNVPPLSARATLAAWTQGGVSDEAMPSNDANHVLRNTLDSMPHATAQFRQPSGAEPMTRIRQSSQAGGLITEFPLSERVDLHSSNLQSSQNYITSETAQHHSHVETCVLPRSREVNESYHAGATAEHLSRVTAQRSIIVDAHEFRTVTEASQQYPVSEHAELSLHSTTFIENDAPMLDSVEHPFILSKERELPFTYLVSLAAKWDAVQDKELMVQGKIKCFLTGVKTFRFKGQSMFELEVYVDDGSLISEILIHHNVVKKAIGYSPEEVTAALSSKTKAAEDMMNTLKKFQSFLVNFEGMMLLEMNKTSTIPVALEMNQGCETSDAWLLLRRLKPTSTSSFFQSGQSDVIQLSP